MSKQKQSFALDFHKEKISRKVVMLFLFAVKFSLWLEIFVF